MIIFMHYLFIINSHNLSNIYFASSIEEFLFIIVKRENLSNLKSKMIQTYVNGKVINHYSIISKEMLQDVST